MKKLLNTLYVVTPDSHLAKDGENVVILGGKTPAFRVPLHNLESIVSFGYTGATPAIMQACAENNIGLCFLTENGKFCARVSGAVNGNVLLRRKQYRIADSPDESLKISRIMVSGKIANSRAVVERGIRDYSESVPIPEMSEASAKLKEAKVNALYAPDDSVLRGIEGDSANVYFGVFDSLIVSNKEDFRFSGRNRRPPKDRINALLSFVYTLLAHDVQNALEAVGLDAYVGFLHKDRPGRAGLALDMMEEMRAYLADRLVLTLVNRRQINASDFEINGADGIILKSAAKKELVSAWQKRKRDIFRHPFLGEDIPTGLLPHVQAMLLARYIRGDIDAYPVFLIQ